MSFRFGALLCLSGLAACSHEPPRTADNTANDSYSTEPAPEPALQPAPFEGSGQASERSGLASEGSGRVNPPAATTPSTTDAPRASAAPPAPAAAPPAAPDGTQPDNTKVNARDRDSAALTPLDQGGSEADRKTTQQIRQAVVGDDTLSFTAKNVKIITINGKVTLRGPVKTQQERSAIEAAARKVAGAAQIDNQLEVKK